VSKVVVLVNDAFKRCPVVSLSVRHTEVKCDVVLCHQSVTNQSQTGHKLVTRASGSGEQRSTETELV